MTHLLHADLTYYLRGVGFKIRNALGAGHKEADYENALVYTLEADRVPFRHQAQYQVTYRNRQIGEYYPDLTLADGTLQLDLKAAPAIVNLHKAQVLSYLAVTQAQLGLLMNFGAASMEYARLPNFLDQKPRSRSAHPPPPDLLYPELTHCVLDGLWHIYDTVGPGFLHQIYRRATRVELAHQGINFTYLKELPLRYQNAILCMKPVRFLHLEKRILLATVALSQVTPAHTEKLRWAMRTTDCRLGLIANFYPERLQCHFLRLG